MEVKSKALEAFKIINPIRRYSYEKNDCTVRALAYFLGYDYCSAHRILADAGRVPREGFVMEELMAELGYKRNFSKLKVCDFIKRHSVGTYMLLARRPGRSHVFTIIDGIIHDRKVAKKYLNRRVAGYWRAS